jgi:VIT1/CCC1 family predicted Fe2+/Mn2+ transporter
MGEPPPKGHFKTSTATESGGRLDLQAHPPINEGAKERSVDDTGVPRWQLIHHTRVDPHGRGRAISDLILGAQDGVVNVLGVLLGVSAASGSSRLAVAAAMAAAFAESLSMGAVAYTSSVADNDVYRAERAREYRHLQVVPALERSEVRELYRRKGFDGELLERIVETITANPDAWVAVMMAEEHGLAPVTRRHSLRSALVVFVASLAGSLLPVMPFLALPLRVAIPGASVLAIAVLFGIGAYKAKTTVGRPFRAGVAIAAIGMASALAGWAIGALFGSGRL